MESAIFEIKSTAGKRSFWLFLLAVEKPRINPASPEENAMKTLMTAIAVLLCPCFLCFMTSPVLAQQDSATPADDEILIYCEKIVGDSQARSEQILDAVAPLLTYPQGRKLELVLGLLQLNVMEAVKSAREALAKGDEERRLLLSVKALQAASELLDFQMMIVGAAAGGLENEINHLKRALEKFKI